MVEENYGCVFENCTIVEKNPDGSVSETRFDNTSGTMVMGPKITTPPPMIRRWLNRIVAWFKARSAR